MAHEWHDIAIRIRLHFQLLSRHDIIKFNDVLKISILHWQFQEVSAKSIHSMWNIGAAYTGIVSSCGMILFPLFRFLPLSSLQLLSRWRRSSSRTSTSRTPRGSSRRWTTACSSCRCRATPSLAPSSGSHGSTVSGWDFTSHYLIFCLLDGALCSLLLNVAILKIYFLLCVFI